MKQRRWLYVAWLMALLFSVLAMPVAAAGPAEEIVGFAYEDGLTFHNADTELQNKTSQSGIAPFWDYTNYVVHGIKIGSGGSTTVTSAVYAYKSTYRISGTITLQRWTGSIWVEEESWDISGTGAAKVTKSYTVSPGKYRVKTDVTVNGEFITVYSEIKSYNG